jgi:DNA-binding transcriptional LysR family regulator
MALLSPSFWLAAMSSLRTRNLNLIPILRALLVEESVVKAAEQMCLSQPAVSGALARLREALDDPILVRTGKGMQLTPRAERLRAPLERICADIERLFAPEVFDPLRAQDRFVVAAPDHLVYVLGRVLLGRLQHEAPGVRIQFVDVPIHLPAVLEEGGVHLAACADFGLWDGLCSQPLPRDRIVAAVAPDHPLAGRDTVSLASLLAYPCLGHAPRSRPGRVYHKPAIGMAAMDWVAQVSSPQFMEALLLATEKPNVARVPAVLVEHLCPLLPLKMLEIEDEDTGHDMKMFWTAVHDDAPAHRWLRALVADVLRPGATMTP